MVIYLKLTGVVVFLLAILSFGLPACDGVQGNWAETSWSGEDVGYEGGDYLSFSGSLGPGTTEMGTYSYEEGWTGGGPGATGSEAGLTGYGGDVSQYSQYFTMEGGYPTGTTPAPVDITGQAPSTLYMGGQAVPYSQYQTYATTFGPNSLWIRGTTSWAQYVMCPLYSSLQMIAYASTGGTAGLYEIYPGGYRTIYSQYMFYPGYNGNLYFFADEVGRHILLFVINNQPSNAVIIDVVSGWTPAPTTRYAKITIMSSWLKSYDVYVDGYYWFTEGEGGIPDGICSFTVTGNQYHTIKVKRGGHVTSSYKYFASGRAYTMTINN